MTNIEKQIQTAARLIKESTKTVALTGAGISTPSGIPDFRSPGSGLWSQVNPMEVASIIAFRQHPAGFYEWVRPLATKIFNAKPNSAHHALAQLEAAGKLTAVITQNIDGLHQAANSEKVLEVHGHIREVTCIRCYTVKESVSILESFLKEGTIPRCECGGTLKPNVILFGEQLPIQTILEARATAEEADLMLVVGSSLEVAPISDLPYEAVQRGTKIIIVNYQETYMDSRADVVIHQEVIEVLPQIANLALNTKI
jgi:NAD-dependent deacetylase